MAAPSGPAGNPDFWDERYLEPGWAYGQEPNEFLSAEAPRIPPGEVLCLAEGEGRNAVHLAGLGYRIEAVDFAGLEPLVCRELQREVLEGRYHKGTGAVVQFVGRKA